LARRTEKGHFWITFRWEKKVLDQGGGKIQSGTFVKRRVCAAAKFPVYEKEKFQGEGREEGILLKRL